MFFMLEKAVYVSWNFATFFISFISELGTSLKLFYHCCSLNGLWNQIRHQRRI
jgi:hypothetical protein